MTRRPSFSVTITDDDGRELDVRVWAEAADKQVGILETQFELEPDERKPRLLDLFSCQGGAAMGYGRAGFEVVGVDIVDQPRYPFTFVKADALEYLAAHGHEFDAIHASPPCQAYSSTKSIRGNEHPDLVAPTRALLLASGKPYVIENVVGAPLENPTLLCGSMFDLITYRHRLFETSFPLPFIMDRSHGATVDKLSGPSAQRMGQMVQVVGKVSYKGGTARYKEAIGADWMNEAGLAQAIPPAYTEFIGRHLRASLPRRVLSAAEEARALTAARAWRP